MAESSPMVVIGGGSWGTALALLLCRNGVPVKLWDIDMAHVQSMAKERCNQRFLPGIPFPDSLQLVEDLKQAVVDAHDILIAVPSHAFRPLCTELVGTISKDARIVWATKGLDTQGSFLHEVAEEILGNSHPFAVLSGPSFAKEVAKEMPTAVTLATSCESYALDLLKQFQSDSFRVYLSDDLIGVQLCGTVKNVLAIATGISDGLAYGANARAALITCGLAEMTRLGLALGAKPETFMSLAGVGDLILTCTDDQSRNRRFGLAVGKGLAADEAEKSIGQVVEGIKNAEQVYRLAQKHKIDVPIIERIYRILNENLSAQDAARELMTKTVRQQ